MSRMSAPAALGLNTDSPSHAARRATALAVKQVGRRDDLGND
jgi:hypothetical protein